MQFTWVLITVFSLFATYAAADTSSHIEVRNSLVVERSDIVMTDRGEAMMPGYLTIQNRTSLQVSLISVESPNFGSISLHRAVPGSYIPPLPFDGNVLPIPGHSQLSMRPIGIHLMFGDPLDDLRPGDRVDLVLTFNNGLKLHTNAGILAPGSDADRHQPSTINGQVR